MSVNTDGINVEEEAPVSIEVGQTWRRYDGRLVLVQAAFSVTPAVVGVEIPMIALQVLNDLSSTGFADTLSTDVFLKTYTLAEEYLGKDGLEVAAEVAQLPLMRGGAVEGPGGDVLIDMDSVDAISMGTAIRQQVGYIINLASHMNDIVGQLGRFRAQDEILRGTPAPTDSQALTERRDALVTIGSMIQQRHNEYQHHVGDMDGFIETLRKLTQMLDAGILSVDVVRRKDEETTSDSE